MQGGGKEIPVRQEGIEAVVHHMVLPIHQGPVAHDENDDAKQHPEFIGSRHASGFWITPITLLPASPITSGSKMYRLMGTIQPSQKATC